MAAGARLTLLCFPTAPTKARPYVDPGRIRAHPAQQLPGLLRVRRQGAVGGSLPRVAAVPRGEAGRLLPAAAAVFLAYIAAAEVGFRVAFAAQQITTVWAPTGIAVAALLLCGARLWPAIWAAALVVNAATNAPLWTAFVLASGNTLEALAAAWLLRSLPGFDVSFRRVIDVVAFLAVAVAAATISASIGVGTLCAAAVQPWSRLGPLWFDWWLGDALGALVVAPALLHRGRLLVLVAAAMDERAAVRRWDGAPHGCSSSDD